MCNHLDKITRLMKKNNITSLKLGVSTNSDLEDALVELALNQVDLENALVELASMIGGEEIG